MERLGKMVLDFKWLREAVFFLGHKGFSKKKGLEKRNAFKALYLVAGAGFEPTTFGL